MKNYTKAKCCGNCRHYKEELGSIGSCRTRVTVNYIVNSNRHNDCDGFQEEEK